MTDVYAVWITSHENEGIPQQLHDWSYDDDGPLVLRLSAFANDAVITIEPRIDSEL